jgi:hypothetical protein
METKINIKLCKKCNIIKSLDNFSKGAKNKDRLNPWCKECHSEYKKINYPNKIEYHKQKSQNWRENNTEYDKERNKKWLQENISRRQEYKKTYHINNKEKINSYRREKRLKDMLNPEFRLKETLRKKYYKATKQKNTTLSSYKILGCTIEEFKYHLESKFQDGMSWDNYGYNGWHIDHIRPISSFNLFIQSDVEKCFHYTNLQPLWAIDNLKKGSKFGN